MADDFTPDDLDLIYGKPQARNIPEVKTPGLESQDLDLIYGRTPEQPATVATPAGPSRSYWDAFSGGVERGVAQVRSTVPTLQGVYAETQGDEAGAAARFAEAQELQKAAPEAQQDFKEISGIEDAVVWGIEKFGEQVPVLGTAILTGGMGGLIGGAVTRGVLSSVGARALAAKAGAGIGGYAATAGMETAGIADELRGATGSYNPGVAVAGGAAAGLLELATPLMIGKALFSGKNLASSVGKAALQGTVVEASTEAAQEAIALTARTYADPNYKFFSPESGWRVLESAAAGGLIGGGISGGVQAGNKLVGERPGSQRKLDSSEVEGWSERPVSWLYDKVKNWGDPRTKELREAMRINPDLDAADANILLDTIGIDWIRAGARGQQTDAIGRFIESKTSRYAHPLFPDRLMTSTDLEESLAFLPPGENIAKSLIEVNQGSLTPAAISAELSDAPMDPTDPRVFVLPGTSRQVEGALRAEYDQLFSLSPEDAQVKYKELLERGLRVVPSYGSSFIYTGDLKGRVPKKIPTSGRSIGVTKKSQGFISPTDIEVPNRRNLLRNIEKITAYDLEKIAPGEAVSLDKDGNIPVERLVFPPGMTELDKEVLIAKAEATGNVVAKAQMLLDRGVYTAPRINDRYIILGKDVLAASKYTSPILATSVARGDSYRADRYSAIIPETKALPVEIIMAPELKPEVQNELRKAVQKLEIILKQLRVLPPSKITIMNRNPEPSSAGIYRPGTASIEIDGRLSSALHTLIHEIGHHVTLNTWKNLPVDLKQSVWQNYRRHVINMQKEASGQARFGIDPTGESQGPTYYVASFEEYLTEQFVRYIVHKQIGFEQLPAQFGRLGHKLLEYFSKVEALGPQYVENMQPDFALSKWMEWLKGDLATDRKPMRRLERILQMDSSHPLAVRMTELLTQQLEANKDLFPSGWTLEVGDPGGDNIAVAINSKQAVIFGLAALEVGAKRVIAHEAVHASRTLFTPQEWGILVEASKKIFGLRTNVLRNWGSFYRDAAREAGLEGEEARTFVDERLEEEAVAVMIEQRATGINHGSIVSQIIDKLLLFMQRIAQALQVDFGWTTKEAIISDFFKGEIAARDQRAELVDVYGKWLEAENSTPDVMPEAAVIDEVPEQIKKIDANTWVAVFRERLPNRKVFAVQYRFYTGEPGVLRGKPVAEQYAQFKASGQGVGVAFLSHNPKGFEVDYVSVRREFRRQGWAKKFYTYIEKDLKQAMKPSGILLPDGYAMWKARDPHAVRYHVFDSIDQMWASPNYIRGAIELNSKIIATNNNTVALQTAKDTLDRYKALLKKVDAKAWLDPELDKMFRLKDKQRIYETGLVMAAQSRAADENVLTDNAVEAPGFEQTMLDHMAASQSGNEKTLKLPKGMGAPMQAEFRPMRNIFKNANLTPQQKRMLNGSLSGEADRIGWFSKKWWGIKQLAWVNPHIDQLQSYTEIMEKWSAKTEYWINRADNIARNWDSQYGLTHQEKEGLAELLFYMTEMRYRTPLEVAQKVVRRPSQQELVIAFRQFKLGARAQQLYAEIEGEFAGFLTEVERISIESIQREFARQRVNGVPSAAEQKAMAELAAEMAALRKKPYFPMVRFGEWTLTVRNPNQNNQIEAFYTFESQKERNAYISNAARQHMGMDLHIGRVPESTVDFIGLPGPMLRRIKAELPGLSSQQLDWLDQFGHHTSPEGSFRKRWLDRKETAGYSLDAFRVFANYFQMGSKYLSRLEFKDQAQMQIESIRQEARSGVLADSSKRQRIGDFVQEHLNYMLEPGRDWGKVKSLIAIWHLGASPVAAAMNLTQMPMVTVPYLNAVFGVGPTFGALSVAHNALKGSFGGIWRNAPWPGYEKGRQELIAQGKIDAGQAPELGAYASANNLYKSAVGGKAARYLRTTVQGSMWMFGKAERMNRELTYAMTFKLAMDNPNLRYLQDLAFARIDTVNELVTKLGVTGQEAVAIIAAREAIDKTHGIYAPWARPVFMRNNLAATILVFFQYVQMMLFAMRNNPGAVQHLLMLTMMAGLMGLPGADDLDKIVEAVVRRLGWNWSPKNAVREYIQQLTEGTPFSKVGPDLVLHGISRYGFGLGLLPEGAGAPRFDVSGNISMGKLVPGIPDMAKNWGTYQDWNKGLGEATTQASGAGFGVMFSLLQFMANDVGSSEWRKWEKVLPRAVKAQSKAIRMGVDGQETDKSGAWFASFDTSRTAPWPQGDWRDPDDVATLVAQFLGATPAKLSKKWEAQTEIVETVMYYQGRKKILYEQLLKTIVEKDNSSRDDVLKAIDRFNAGVRKDGFPSMGINTRQLRSSLNNRMRSRALKEEGLPAVRGEMPVWRRMQDKYPEVEWKKVK